MQNIYRSLTKKQKERGVVFSSKLVVNLTGSTEANSITRELTKIDNNQMRKLTQAHNFKASNFNYNIVRS